MLEDFYQFSSAPQLLFLEQQMSNPQGVADSGAYHLMSSELTTLLRRDFN